MRSNIVRPSDFFALSCSGLRNSREGLNSGALSEALDSEELLLLPPPNKEEIPPRIPPPESAELGAAELMLGNENQLFAGAAAAAPVVAPAVADVAGAAVVAAGTDAKADGPSFNTNDGSRGGTGASRKILIVSLTGTGFTL
jgi:hypothetical protein